MAFINPITKPILDKLATQLLRGVKKQLEKDGRKASGKSMQTLEAKVAALGEDIAFQLIGEDYLQYQDLGRKAGKMPPVDALTKWVQQKGIETDPSKAKGVAFAISKNMERIGMHSKGKRIDLSQRNFLGKSADAFAPLMQQGLFQAFEKNFEVLVDKFSKQV